MAAPADAEISAEHRGWPLPSRRPWMRMRWHDLLFMHWPVREDRLRELVPQPLQVDTFEGAAWVGVVPFRMSGVMRRGLPDLPGLSAFPELNVRTYVTIDGKPGVWFFSLDAQNRVAVRAARWLFHLPYMDASIALERKDGWLNYRSKRIHRGEPPADLDISYRSVTESFQSVPGRLEHWLTARYCLYAANRRGRLYRGEISHRPWKLQRAECTIRHCSMLDWLDLTPTTDRPLLHTAHDVDVLAWSNRRVA